MTEATTTNDTAPATIPAAQAAAPATPPATPPAATPPAAPPPGAVQAPADAAPPPVDAKPAATGYRPEGLPDHLVGANEQETIDKLAKAYENARKSIAEGVPKTPDEYQLKLDDDAAKLFGPDLAADPVMTALRAKAHEAGLKGSQFNAFMAGAIGELAKMGVVAPPVDAKADLEAVRAQLKDLGQDTSDAAITMEIQKHAAWVDVFGKQNNLKPETIDAMKAFVDIPAGLPVLRAIQQALGASPIAMGGNQAPTTWTKDKLREAQADPRLNPSSPKYDRQFVEDVDRAYRQVYGNG